SFLVIITKEFLIFLDDAALEPGDHVDRDQYNHGEQQYDLKPADVSDQFFEACCKRKAESSKDCDPHSAASQGKRGKPAEAEMSQPIKYRTGGSQAIYVLDDEHRQNTEFAH